MNSAILIIFSYAIIILYGYKAFQLLLHKLIWNKLVSASTSYQTKN